MNPLHRTVAAAVASLLALTGGPARALETLQVRLPILKTDFVVRLDELIDADTLFRGNSDLAELNRATGGVFGDRVLEVMNEPVPITPEARAGLEKAVGTPLLRQALLAASALVGVEGLPPDRDGTAVTTAIDAAAAGGPITVRSLLQALPGTTASLDLTEAVHNLRRLRSQHSQADALLARLPAASVDPAFSMPGNLPVLRSTATLAVGHRPEPLNLVVLRPQSGGNGRLAIISHGLWDSPESFEGWGRHLASHGYAVVLPEHPGSDQGQQQDMLSGQVPPPDPEELRHRPLDISAVLDAVAGGNIPGLEGTNTAHTVVIGHSWGATTALQLAGLRASARRLQERCLDLDDPERNISWVLQCSFLSSADKASLADPRVIAVVAVSPPLSLLFDDGAARGMNGRALVVSGSRDWVVPPDPEAVQPFQGQGHRDGHRLVLVGAGNHFNLRPADQPDGGVLRGLILAWVEGAFRAGEAARPAAGSPSLLPSGGWGSASIDMVDATPNGRN